MQSSLPLSEWGRRLVARRHPSHEAKLKVDAYPVYIFMCGRLAVDVGERTPGELLATRASQPEPKRSPIRRHTSSSAMRLGSAPDKPVFGTYRDPCMRWAFETLDLDCYHETFSE
ncbi:hypothetical protein B9Q03_08525 [Candidatus Marsarchaeota G2 archaeon OSP_D]|jgi:hypothetical protein|uniref:Uncharacterized protein n=1 Tax=Candidatus Marsarchaeota G2 archaeon OSP_D TaxID=1978157 RepID=A0A2R6ASM0_9ARCH|nr:MAG: hypothetical protein B9Q03_08525 [Candidatus Marsarchaeota G2 archaeon OSP_D]